MQAMILTAPGRPLELQQVARPVPAAGQILLRVKCCAVCRTDLHVVDGELDSSALPLVPGHQIVGEVVALGDTVQGFESGQRVGVPWLGWTCGNCVYCIGERENLCPDARFTGHHLNGGYAEFCCADSRYCFPLPDDYADEQVAPLLCAGLIGYRSLRMAGVAQRIGFYGFGAAAHILIQVANHKQREVYAFVRPGDDAAKQFALSCGAVWAGESDELPPESLEAAIIFAPVGALVPTALRAVAAGGTVVCAGIHMSDIPQFQYHLLWGERRICSVANLTRRDGLEFLRLAPAIPIATEIHRYPLQHVNEALDDLRHGRYQGSAVITVSH
ncbi:MAG: zinc-dependent alcohol dehydrogenase family protein [Gammaproteobacteria bacterium]|nr:zinc-dependent alcohol dehydrogenase family protein [Gammaproteobacteria bacterium]